MAILGRGHARPHLYVTASHEDAYLAPLDAAQNHMRSHGHPVWGQDLGDEESATSTFQHLLRRGGHPHAEQGVVFRHPFPERSVSSTSTNEQGEIMAALHPHRWDYGTLAHETAHVLDHHARGIPLNTRLTHDEKHDDGFMEHYRNVGNMLMKGAGDELHEAWQRKRGAGSREARYTAPTKRLFGPTYGLDTRLWDGEKLKQSVRQDVLATFAAFCRRHDYRAFREWARVVFFGSEASEWTSKDLRGNNDFDLSIGIEYTIFRSANPSFRDTTDEQIAAAMTREMHAELNDPAKTFEGVEGVYDQTWFANLQGWSIERIRPYAAYNVLTEQWIVRPPHLPNWSAASFPQGPGLAEEVRGIIEMAQGILKMPEPHRTQNGAALWEFVHSNRSNAFGGQGEGWWDSRNVVEKALDQKGLMQQLFELHRRAAEDPSTLDAPKDWSNDPARAR